MMSSTTIRRNRPGTRAADLYNWAPEEFNKMKGLFSVQEYIQELIRHDPSDITKIIEQPVEVDVNVWKYEHLRQFILETNLLVVQLQRNCTKETCPKMKATDDWLYLCAVHKDTVEVIFFLIILTTTLFCIRIIAILSLFLSFSFVKFLSFLFLWS